MWQKKRSRNLELMDLPADETLRDEYDDCLRLLGHIGRFLGGDRATLRALRRSMPRATSFLDVGCGGGQFATRIAHTFPSMRVVGVDRDVRAVECAQRYKEHYVARCGAALGNLSFELQSEHGICDTAASFDVVHSCLVLHHIFDEDIPAFLNRLCVAARRTVIINDLQRSVIAYGLFHVLRPLIKNTMCFSDGLLSIRRAFHRNELEAYVDQIRGNVRAHRISWQPLFRFVLELDVKPDIE